VGPQGVEIAQEAVGHVAFPDLVVDRLQPDDLLFHGLQGEKVDLALHLAGTRGMKAYDFKVLLEPDETGGYVATCPSLPRCDSQGDTVDGALDNIREAIELCLEDIQAHGEVIPDPSRVLVGSVVVTR
jgi:antitoxin HicB